MTPLEDLFTAYCKDQYFDEEPNTLYDPVNYILELPAKRIRPHLCLLSYQLFREDAERALPQAFAIELFHNFTLMHDDIMDEAPLRRGQASVHKKFGLNKAILSGDVMLIHCYPYVVEGLDDSQAVQALQVFTKTAVGICHGQQYDLDFETGQHQTTESYLQMIQGKTAILLGCAMSLGGLVAGADQDMQSRLYEIGEGMGMAFQIQDDLLDVFGSSQKTGKVQGGDIRQGKKTLLYLAAKEIGGTRVAGELEMLYTDRSIDGDLRVARAIEVFRSLGVGQYARSLKERYYQQAHQLLLGLDGRQETIGVLDKMFLSLLDRDH